MNGEKPAAVYVRISSDPSGERAGVERQRGDCEQLAAQLGFADTVLYEDNDVSAFSGKARPAFERMLSDVGDGRVATIVVWAVDRLYRRLTDLERIVATLDGAGVAVHAVKSGDIDLSTADGRLHARLLGSVAQHESEKKSERITARARQRALVEKRMVSSQRPFGWRSTGKGLVPDPQEAPALAAAYADIRDGLTLRATWQRLGDKVPTGKMTATTLGKVLRNPRNAGLVSYRGEVVGEAADGLRIVDRDTFDRVSAILTDPSRRTSPGRPANTWLGGGLLRCGRCGGPMASSRKDGTAVYVCSREHHLTRRRALIDGKVLNMARDVLGSLGKRGLLVQAAADDGGAHELRQRITDSEDRLEALAALLAGGELSPADFAAATAKIRARMQADAEALTLRAQRPAMAALASADDVTAAWDLYVEDANVDMVRSLLGDLLDGITCHQDQSTTLHWAEWTGLEASELPSPRMSVEERRDKVRSARQAGQSIVGTARELGIHPQTVRADLRTLGLLPELSPA